MDKLMVVVRFIHLLSLVLWIGGMAFFSLIAAPAIFKVLPRETAGDVVGEIFPKYWILGYAGSVTALTTLLLSSFYEKAYAWASITLLVLMTCLSFYTGIVVGNKAREVKAQIRNASGQSQNEAQKEELAKRFKSLHRQSAILNGAIILLGVAVIFMTAYHQPVIQNR